MSWCHLPGPAPSGAVARGPGRARAAQYRSKCNALSRCARPPPPPPLALCPRPHGSGIPIRATGPVGRVSTEVHSVAAVSSPSQLTPCTTLGVHCIAGSLQRSTRAAGCHSTVASVVRFEVRIRTPYPTPSRQQCRPRLPEHGGRRTAGGGRQRQRQRHGGGAPGPDPLRRLHPILSHICWGPGAPLPFSRPQTPLRPSPPPPPPP